jgi:hypothetical protein
VIFSNNHIDQEWLKNAAQGRARADVPCPLCSSKSSHPRAKVLRVWDHGDCYGFYCARCEAGGSREGPHQERTPEQQAEHARKRADEERREQERLAQAAAIWEASIPIAGTPAETWLEARGIAVDRIPGDLRFHPECPFEGNEASQPAFLTRYIDALTGIPKGVRRRPIVAGQRAKTRGPQKGCVVRLWPVVGESLCLAEGIETAMFAATGVKLHGKLLQPMWAAGNAGEMKRFPVLPGIKFLTLIVDNDKSNTGQDAAKACAERWRAVGVTVITVTPKRPADRATYDLNDMHKGRVCAAIEIKDLVDIQVFLPETQQGTEEVSVEDARDGFKQVLESFNATSDDWHASEDKASPPVWGIKITTGGGKTHMACEAMASRKVAHMVPTHKLSQEIADRYRGHGVKAEVIRGRSAANPVTGKTMCSWLPQVELAVAAGLNVEETCCKSKGSECSFYNICAYQNQFRQEADVYILAHQNLFHANNNLPQFGSIVIDENCHQAGIGISKNPISIFDIEHPVEAPLGVDVAEILRLRKKLADTLAKQKEPGGFRSEYLSGLSTEDCTKAIKLEWQVINKATSGIEPDMNRRHIERASREILPWVRQAHKINRIWAHLRDMIECPEIMVSGRIAIESGKVKTRGVKSITAQWQIPTLMMSATLAPTEILRAFWPQAQIVSELEIEMPNASVTQIVAAPVAQSKLKVDLNIKRLRRLIQQEWMRTGRGKMLVVAQKDFADWLRREGKLPKAISVEHFNAIEGLDGYKDVSHLMVIGRPMPKPEAVEAMAGALTGSEPVGAEIRANGSSWYQKVSRNVRLKDGSARPLVVDEHPDPVAEAVRWQICEGELVQAIGRARGVNRTAENPVRITIVADVVLPMAVDTVVSWTPPSRAVEMATAGVMLFSGTDMARAFPEIWTNDRAVEDTMKDRAGLLEALKAFAGNSEVTPKTLEELLATEVTPKTLVYILTRKMGVTSVPPLLVEYHPAGTGQRRRLALFDPAVVPSPRAWLEAKIGPLARYDEYVPFERTEVHVDKPGGQRITLERLVRDGEVSVGHHKHATPAHGGIKGTQQ